MSDQPKPVNDPQADAGYDQPKPVTDECEHNFTPDLEYDPTGETINCEHCGEPKPASGEWTVYSVMKLRQHHWHEEDKNNAVAIAHNAALAAEREQLATVRELREHDQKALAAEKHQAAFDVMDVARKAQRKIEELEKKLAVKEAK